MKENDLVHDEWEKWLKTVDFTPRTAQRMIKAFEQFGNATSQLPVRKIFEMLSCLNQLTVWSLLIIRSIPSLQLVNGRQWMK
ncbi:DUF3102 domain-containing protein [Paenibacillus sp. JJ1683]